MFVMCILVGEYPLHGNIALVGSGPSGVRVGGEHIKDRSGA